MSEIPQESRQARYELAVLLINAADLIGDNEERNETVADMVGRLLGLPDTVTLEMLIVLLTAIRDRGVTQ